MAKKIALKNILQNIGSVESISVDNSDEYKSLRLGLKESDATINLPKELIPEEMLNKKEGDFHFSISGKIQNSEGEAVKVKINNYSCSLSKPTKKESPVAGS